MLHRQECYFSAPNMTKWGRPPPQRSLPRTTENQDIFWPRQNEGRSYLGVGGNNSLRAMMIWMDQSPNQKTNKALRKYQRWMTWEGWALEYHHFQIWCQKKPVISSHLDRPDKCRISIFLNFGMFFFFGEGAEKAHTLHTTWKIHVYPSIPSASLFLDQTGPSPAPVT